QEHQRAEPAGRPIERHATGRLGRVGWLGRRLGRTMGLALNSESPNQNHSYPNMNRNYQFIAFACAAALSLLVAGCETTGEKKSTENLLVTAGFKSHPANTAQKQKLLASLPAGKVSTIQKNGHVYYVYPDMTNNVALVGTQQEYTTYRQLKYAKNI